MTPLPGPTLVDYELTRPRPEEALDGLNPILANVFAAEPPLVTRWIDLAGRRNIRLLRAGSELIGGLFVIPMGQWVGGRSVSMAGIAGVAVRPESRRRGAATAMMRQALLDLFDRGFAVSTLYGSNQPLYRRVGYEQAGSHFEVRIDPTRLVGNTSDRALKLRPITDADRPAIEATYQTWAAPRTGLLDRGPYVWSRQTHERDGRPRVGYLVYDDPNRIEGYLYYRYERHDRGRFDLIVTDLAVTTPRAGRRLWAFLADHSSMAGKLSLNIAPWEPWYLQLRDQLAQFTMFENWMLRIVDARRALQARGYPPGPSVEIDLEIVDDDVVSSNNGRWALEVSDGKAQIQPGGSGSTVVSIRGLAAIYSGFVTPTGAAMAGLLEGSTSDLRPLQSLLAGPAPWMPDMF